MTTNQSLSFVSCTKYFVLIVSLFFCTKGFSQLSSVHYIPPLTCGNTAHDQYMYISTPSITPISYTIFPIGFPPITGTVTNIAPMEIGLGNGFDQLFQDPATTSMVTTDKGYRVEATGNIYVSVRMRAGAPDNFNQAGALVSKGLSALGTRFRVGTYDNKGTTNSTNLNFVSIMATEDNTNVTFSDFENGVVIESGITTAPGSTIVVTLNKGESYTIATYTSTAVPNQDGLIGVLVTSDKPIVVNTGSANGSFHETSSGQRDFGIDQIVDTSKTGDEYILVKAEGNDEVENILIVADIDGTEIFVNGNPTPVATINAGDYYIIEGTSYTPDGNMYVRTSNDVSVYQGVGGTLSSANQGMFFVPPLTCEATGNLASIATIEKIGLLNGNYEGGITIVTQGVLPVPPHPITVYQNRTAIPLNTPQVEGPFTVPGKPGYITYKITGLTGDIAVDSTGELYVAYYNFNGLATSGSFYAGFPVPPDIIFDPNIANLDYCIPNAVIEAGNVASFTSFEFQIFNEITEVWDTVQIGDIGNPVFTPTQPGTYRVQGVLSCTGLNLESSSVFISFCPSDFDGDGIIDNIDIDDDNDGITDCAESLGNGSLNLTPGNETITLPSGTIIPATGSTTTVMAPSTLTTNAAGMISSTLATGANTESEYQISFAPAVNIKFEQSGIPPNSLSEEYFIVRITPPTKNITLVDPDDRLLVDTNVDGGFETGVIQFSASEIHFKVNPAAPPGARPFEFNAKRVDDFIFIHGATDPLPSTSGNFEGLLSVTCYAKDNDGDGVSDDIDLDSDNDGIPDIIENAGQNITLSGNDVDNDGLDDVFESGLADTLLDTDGDGVPDFYDLDSDNDGIFDLVESQSNAGTQVTFPDTDFNGIIDGSNFGVNGWYDPAETAPDSGLIGHTIEDVDTDGSFNYTDSDTDGDGCNDFIEAGFTDVDGNGFLGDSPMVVNPTNGILTSATDGFTIPSDISYLIPASIAITNEPMDVEICPGDSTSFTVVTDNPGIYQWEVNDGSSWVVITDNAFYSGSQTDVLTISSTPQTFDNNRYRVTIEVTNNICLNLISTEAVLTIDGINGPIIPINLNKCDDDVSSVGVTIFNLNLAEDDPLFLTNVGDTIRYYETQTDAEAGGTVGLITDPSAFESRVPIAPATADAVWVRVQPLTGCATLYRIILNVDPPAIAYPITEITSCEISGGLGSFPINIANIEAQVLNGQTGMTISYSYLDANGVTLTNQTTLPSTLISKSQSINVTVENTSDNSCFDSTTLQLSVIPKPIFNVNDYTICLTSNEDTTLEVLDLTPETVRYTYEWSFTPNNSTTTTVVSTSPAYTTNLPGTYSITVTNTDNGCISDKKNLTVFGIEQANFNDGAVRIIEFTDNNSVEILRNQIGPSSTTYEYALVPTDQDGNLLETPFYQDKLLFNNLSPGAYTIHVRDVSQKCDPFLWVVYILGIPKYFTPNGDNVNDTWTIKGLNEKRNPNTKVHIFDRHGKLLKELNLKPNKAGWDGTYNGNLLPGTDYWYRVYLSDGREISGHFALRR